MIRTLTSIRTAEGFTLYRVAHNPKNTFEIDDKYSRVCRLRPTAQSPEYWLNCKRQTKPRTLVYVGDKIKDKNPELFASGYVYVNVGSILSVDTSNVKLAKTAKQFADVLSIIYYGAPSNVAGMGINTCRFASAACRELCLNLAGNGSITGVQLSRIARTRLSRWAPVLFWKMFSVDLERFKRKAKRENKRLACRPNGTTDERSPELLEIMRTNPDVEFYDYSAVPDSLDVADSLPNYSVTFSRKETAGNLVHVREAIQRGFNVAVVVDPDAKQIALRQRPELFVDFDKHDLRLPDVDGRGKIGLLTPKGRMRKELKPTEKRTMTYRGYAQLLNHFGECA